MEAKRILLGKAFIAVLTALFILNVFFFFFQQSTRKNLHSYSDIYNEKANEHLTGYEEYLKKIETDAKKLQAVSLFSDPDSFAYKNTVKTAADFAKMKGIKLSAGQDLAVTVFFEDSWTDYSVLILICLVCGLFLAERREGLWSMFYATPAGRKKLACNRILVLFAASWIGTLVIAGTKILLSAKLFNGTTEWSRVLQSIPMFGNVPTPLTIGEFWLFYIFVKAMGTFLIGLVFWAVLSSISNLGLALCVSGILLGTEFVLTTIPSSSIFAPLRYINIFSYVDYIKVFVRYLNISFFGIPISGSDLVLIIMLPAVVIFMVINILIAEKKHPVSRVNPILMVVDAIQKKLDSKRLSSGLMLQEIKKLFVKRKGVFILIILIIVLCKMSAPPREEDPLDMYLQYYQREFAGPITDETIERLETELETSSESERRSALRMLISDVREAPEGAWLVQTGPYDAIWNNNLYNYQRSTALVVLLFLTMLLSPINSQERQYNMNTLLRSSPCGRKSLWIRKQLLTSGSTVLVWVAVYGCELYKTAVTYGSFQCLDAPLYSLKFFGDLDKTITIGQAMVMYYALKLIVMLCAAETCFFLSGLCSKNRDAIILNVGALIVSAALAAIGSGVGEWLSYLMPLSCVEVMFSIWPFAASIIVGGIATWASSKSIPAR